MERDCESELSKLNTEQNACIYHFGASVIHGQRSNILRLLKSGVVFCISTIILLKLYYRYKLALFKCDMHRKLLMPLPALLPYRDLAK